MLGQDWLHILVGIFGLIITVNSIFVIASSKYYSFFSKTFFIEPSSETGRKNVEEKVEAERNSQRYGLSTVLILLGLLAIGWALGFGSILEI